MSVQSEITRLSQAKSDIAAALEEQGVEVPSAASISAYGDLVRSITGGVTTAYATCSTAAGTAAKVATLVGSSGWTLAAGSMVSVFFSATNSASNPTLNVGGTGAKNIYYGASQITTSSLGYAGTANRLMNFVYDGTQYRFAGWGYDSNTTYTNVKLGHGYATCATAAATVAKVATLSSYTLTTGGIVAVKFTYDVPASATLNINSKGAKAIYHKGAAIAAGVIKAGDTATFIYSTYYHLISLDRDTNTTYSAATQSAAGLMSAADKKKLDGVATGANAYTHPSYTAKSSGLYKVTVDASGHVSATAAVSKSDITGLGIPAQDTTYSAATTSAAGLMSAADKTKLNNIDAAVTPTITGLDGTSFTTTVTTNDSKSFTATKQTFIQAQLSVVVSASIAAGTSMAIGQLSDYKPNNMVAISVYHGSSNARRYMGCIDAAGKIYIRSSAQMTAATYNLHVNCAYVAE